MNVGKDNINTILFETGTVAVFLFIILSMFTSALSQFTVKIHVVPLQSVWSWLILCTAVVFGVKFCQRILGTWFFCFRLATRPGNFREFYWSGYDHFSKNVLKRIFIFCAAVILRHSRCTWSFKKELEWVNQVPSVTFLLRNDLEQMWNCPGTVLGLCPGKWVSILQLLKLKTVPSFLVMNRDIAATLVASLR